MLKSAYTLIEILIVVAVLGVLTFAGLASYSRFREKQDLMQAAEDLVTRLRLLQKDATAAIGPSTCSTALSKVTFKVDNATQGTITWDCGTAPNEIYKPSNKVKFKNPFGATIVFVPLTGFVTSSGTIELRSTNNTFNVPIVTTSGGAVSVGTVSP